jgi:hypothetical protein
MHQPLPKHCTDAESILAACLRCLKMCIEAIRGYTSENLVDTSGGAFQDCKKEDQSQATLGAAAACTVDIENERKISLSL